MRLRRVQFTMRRMMVAVAVVGSTLALGLGAVTLWQGLGSPTLVLRAGCRLCDAAGPDASADRSGNPWVRDRWLLVPAEPPTKGET